MQIGLKIDVDTYRGTHQGVPPLMEMLQRHGARATFLFSLGPDNTGRAVRRALRPGFLTKVSRTSVVGHYGFRTLLNGTVLPGPDIGKNCADLLRQVDAAGFEVGIHTWDHVRWQDGVERATPAWTETEMRRAADRFASIFGRPAATHGAAGWQMNGHAFRLTQRMEFLYCSDTRGRHPFLPVWHGELTHCPQIPTTLPTLDELIGAHGINENNVHKLLLGLTKAQAPHGHVYTLHAELEGMKLAPVFERLLGGWRKQGYELVALREIAAGLNRQALPIHVVERGSVIGRSGTLMVQGKEFLS